MTLRTRHYWDDVVFADVTALPVHHQLANARAMLNRLHGRQPLTALPGGRCDDCPPGSEDAPYLLRFGNVNVCRPHAYARLRAATRTEKAG